MNNLKLETPVILLVGLGAAVVLWVVLLVMLVLANMNRSEALDRVKKLEGELALTRGQLYDLQWKNDNEIEDTNNAQLMAMSVLQWKLDSCLKGPK